MAWKSSLKNGVFESKNAVKAILMRFTAFYPLCPAWEKTSRGGTEYALRCKIWHSAICCCCFGVGALRVMQSCLAAARLSDANNPLRGVRQCHF